VSLGICSIIIWTLRRNLAFLNLSSYHALYSARLARAYLGASNPARHNRPEGLHISDPIPGDDCGMHDYRPHANGGPLHLINVTINETVSGESQVQQRDRKGLPMIVGPNSINVGVRHLARANYETKITEVSPLQHGGFHVFGRGPKSVQQLRLSDWVGISGAAFSTGAGAHTSLALSILTGIANVRLGYWWDSRVRPKDRSPETKSSRGANVSHGTLAEIFPLATHLIHEFTGRFHGPASQRWYLSDGGHFENTGCYELIRRRAPLIFICDCGADPEYRFEDLSNLVRKARIDYDTDIEFCDAETLKKIFDMFDKSAGGGATLPRELFGDLQKLFRQASAESPGFPGALYSGCHAAIAKVRYDISAENESRRDFDSLIFVIKPSLTGDEPLDLLQYQFKNPAFPQEPTSDQFFDEAQWESYRRLGLHIGEKLFDSVALVQLLNGILAQTGGEGSSSKT
jgi:hypothetical protein